MASSTVRAEAPSIFNRFTFSSMGICSALETRVFGSSRRKIDRTARFHRSETNDSLVAVLAAAEAAANCRS